MRITGLGEGGHLMLGVCWGGVRVRHNKDQQRWTQRLLLDDALLALSYGVPSRKSGIPRLLLHSLLSPHCCAHLSSYSFSLILPLPLSTIDSWFCCFLWLSHFIHFTYFLATNNLPLWFIMIPSQPPFYLPNAILRLYVRNDFWRYSPHPSLHALSFLTDSVYSFLNISFFADSWVLWSCSKGSKVT